MLKLKVSPEVEEFRKELKTWLVKNKPPVCKNDSSLESFISVGKEWQKKLATDSWIGVHWPKEYGGRSLTLVEEAVVQEELVRANSPQILGLFGLTMVGPVLISHGTEAQKKRYLHKILLGEEIWCQGFSEPGAGSDLAAIKTKAVKVENGYEIVGQKVWTSFAHVADWCFLLVRTSEEEKIHQGLSYMLIDMKQKGIDVRPLKQITGDEEFYEVFFDNAFVPEENVVGQVGDGWKIAISTLMHERVVLTFARQLQSEVALKKLIDQFGSDASGSKLKELSDCISQAVAVKALAYDHLTSYADGKSPGAEGSMDKLFWTESFQNICKLALKLNGHQLIWGTEDQFCGIDVQRYLYSRGRTIAAGTSEIQKSIIAERVLELPRLKFLK